MIPDWIYPKAMVNLSTRWQKDKPKGDKRNGTMSRQQAFGGLFK